jgi:signal transduction histidine kinase
MRLSLRTKIMAAILVTVVATDALAAWAVNDRIQAGARREADRVAGAQAAQLQAVYQERAATLAAESEAVSLYPAVIAALADNNRAPLLAWSGQVAQRQQTNVTVVNADGAVIARGHDPNRAGDTPALAGLKLALGGQIASGTENGDELGLAVRGYAPVVRDGKTLGAVMIADRLDDALLRRLAGSGSGATDLEVGPAGDAGIQCRTPSGDGAAGCRIGVLSPGGAPAATLGLSVPLTDVQRARSDARQALWIVGALVLAAGVLIAWLLARSLTGPLERLTAAAHRIGEGNYEPPIAAAGGDEIGVLARSLELMRGRVAEATTALRDERDVLDAVLESAGEGILMTDPAGTAVVTNATWTEILGGSRLDQAEHLSRVGGGETLARCAAGWLAESEQMAADDFEQFEPQYRRFRCYSAPVRHHGGPPIGRIFVLRDVTRETEAERMRTALVSSVSHELRSPLTAIKGYTDTLLGDPSWDEASRQEFLEIIASSADKLARLVDDLLDAAKLEAGVLRLEREPVRVERIVRQVVDRCVALAPGREFTVEVAPDLPLAYADPGRLDQMLTNLVENAIKYSPDGGSIAVRAGGGPDDAITISVADHGIGIAPQDAEQLFQRFYRVDNQVTRTTKGTGLGLYICKSLAEAHGGRIWLTSTPGEGSTFSFTLPRLVEDAPQPVPAPAVEPLATQPAAAGASV